MPARTRIWTERFLGQGTIDIKIHRIWQLEPSHVSFLVAPTRNSWPDIVPGGIIQVTTGCNTLMNGM